MSDEITNQQHQDENQLLYKSLDMPRYAVFLNYSDHKSKRAWKLGFQTAPFSQIKFAGDEPTTDELVSCLSGTNAPVWFFWLPVIVKAASGKLCWNVSSSRRRHAGRFTWWPK